MNNIRTENALIYGEIWHAIQCLDFGLKCRIVYSVAEYTFTGEITKEEELPEVARVLIEGFKPLIDKGVSKYTKKKATRDNPGGRPTTEQEAVKTAWNAVAEEVGLGTINSIVTSRKEKINSLLSEHSVEEIKETFERIKNSDFLCGKTERPFRAQFDWIIKPEVFEKLREGGFDRADSEEAQLESIINAIGDSL